MKFKAPIAIIDIAELIGARIIGDATTKVTFLSEIHKVEKGSLTFVDNEKYYNQVVYSTATAIIIDKELECPEGKTLLLVEKPFEAYNFLALYFSPFAAMKSMVSPTAIIGENTTLEPGVVVGNYVTIGDNCLIRANTVLLDNTKIGNNVIIHANSSIGNDAFYMSKQADRSYNRWHSIGRVIIENNVEIGAGCTIDKGVSGDTVIGEGTKIDNQVHIGHGVRVGKYCLLAAQVGIAGKTIIQDYVTIYGQVGISKSLVIGEGAVLLAKTGVPKSLPGDKEYVGIPAGEARSKFREMAAIRQLPDLIQKINELYAAFFKNKQS